MPALIKKKAQIFFFFLRKQAPAADKAGTVFY